MRRLWVLLFVAGITGTLVMALLAWPRRGTDGSGDATRGERANVDAQERVPIGWAEGHEDGGIETIVPDGEWWACSGTATIIVQIEDGVGLVGVATSEAVRVSWLSVAYSDVRWYGVEFHLRGDRRDATWSVRPPFEVKLKKGQLMPDPDDVPDGPVAEFVVDDVRPRGEVRAPFSLYRSKLRDPLVECRERTQIIRHLRRLLSKRD